MHRSLIFVAVTIFALFWLSGMVASLAFKGCVERPLTDDRKAAYCTTAIIAGVPIDLIPSERAKRSPLLLHRGMVSAANGDSDAALADFRRALIAAAERGSTGCLLMPVDLSLLRVTQLSDELRTEGKTTNVGLLWESAVKGVTCTP